MICLEICWWVVLWFCALFGICTVCCADVIIIYRITVRVGKGRWCQNSNTTWKFVSLARLSPAQYSLTVQNCGLKSKSFIHSINQMQWTLLHAAVHDMYVLLGFDTFSLTIFYSKWKGLGVALSVTWPFQRPLRIPFQYSITVEV